MNKQFYTVFFIGLMIHYSSAAPVITLNKSTYDSGEAITIHFSNGPGNKADWIGVYLPGEIPARGTPATLWNYTHGSQQVGEGVPTGSIQFSDPKLEDGEYVVWFFEDEGYKILSDKVSFKVETRADKQLTTSKNSYFTNESIKVMFSQGPANAKDWIGVYHAAQIPAEGNPSLLWCYTHGSKLEGAGLVSGIVEFKSPQLPVGDYEIYFLESEGYKVIDGPVSFTVQDRLKLSSTTILGLGDFTVILQSE